MSSECTFYFWKHFVLPHFCCHDISWGSVSLQQENKNRRPENMLISKHDQPRKVHHTVGSITRPGTDQYCEETLACCDFRCVHDNGTNGNESPSCPGQQCHGDASYTCLTSAGFQYRTLVLLRLYSVFGNAHRECSIIFHVARSDKIT